MLSHASIVFKKNVNMTNSPEVSVVNSLVKNFMQRNQRNQYSSNTNFLLYITCTDFAVLPNSLTSWNIECQLLLTHHLPGLKEMITAWSLQNRPTTLSINHPGSGTNFEILRMDWTLLPLHVDPLNHGSINLFSMPKTGTALNGMTKILLNLDRWKPD